MNLKEKDIQSCYVQRVVDFICFLCFLLVEDPCSLNIILNLLFIGRLISNWALVLNFSWWQATEVPCWPLQVKRYDSKRMSNSHCFWSSSLTSKGSPILQSCRLKTLHPILTSLPNPHIKIIIRSHSFFHCNSSQFPRFPFSVPPTPVFPFGSPLMTSQMPN